MRLVHSPSFSLASLALSLGVLGCHSGRGSNGAGVGRPITLVAAGDTAGWLTPCGCTSNQSGGLLRRGAYLAELRKTAAVVLVDCGGAPGGTARYDQLKFEAILAGERATEVAAHNLGAAEAALGANYLRTLASEQKFPFVSANLYDAQGQRVAPAYRIVNIEGQRLAIVGVLGPQYPAPGGKITEPRQALLDVLPELAGQYDSLVVLAYVPEAELLALATELPEADLLIGGPTGQCLAPRKVGVLQVASATNKGKFLVTFTSDVSHGRLQWRGAMVEMSNQWPDDLAQKENLSAFRQRLAAADLTAAESGLGSLSTVTLPANQRVSGSASCKECHADEFTAWEKSGHHHAWASLSSQGAHVDSFCQRCHVTGFAWTGGFVSAQRSASLQSVGCENCHGPASEHVADPTVKTPLVAREQCVLCHDHENSPEFDYAKYWPRIEHGSSGKNAARKESAP